jgi:hypothetical protein
MTFEFLDTMLVTADGSGLTPSTANQTLATIAVPESKSYKFILVHFELEMAMVTSPVVQQLDIELINDATVVKTWNLSPGATDVLGIHNYAFTFPVAKNNSGSIIVQLGNAAGADADTSIKVKLIWAAGVA